MNPFHSEMLEHQIKPSSFEKIQELISVLPLLVSLAQKKDQILAKGMDFSQDESAIYWKYSDEPDTSYQVLFEFQDVQALMKKNQLTNYLGSSINKVISQKTVTEELAKKEDTTLTTITTGTTLPSKGRFLLDFNNGSFDLVLPSEVEGDYEFRVINNKGNEKPKLITGTKNINGKTRDLVFDANNSIYELRLISQTYGFKLLRY